jgi:N-carbamoylputrescine amidase
LKISNIFAISFFNKLERKADIMKIAGIQIESSDDLQQNVDKCLKLIDLSVEQGANIVIFPELVLTSWFPESIDEKNFSLALTMGAEEISVFKKVAKHKNIAIVLPFFEKDSEIDMLFIIVLFL